MTVIVAVRTTKGEKGLVRVGEVSTAEEARQAVLEQIKNVRVALALVP